MITREQGSERSDISNMEHFEIRMNLQVLKIWPFQGKKLLTKCKFFSCKRQIKMRRRTKTFLFFWQGVWNLVLIDTTTIHLLLGKDARGQEDLLQKLRNSASIYQLKFTFNSLITATHIEEETEQGIEETHSRRECLLVPNRRTGLISITNKVGMKRTADHLTFHASLADAESIKENETMSQQREQMNCRARI